MKENDKIKYIGATEDQILWGNNDDPREILEINKTYTVDKVEVHSWHTKVYLKEFPGLKFNDVSFEKVVDSKRDCGKVAS